MKAEEFLLKHSQELSKKYAGKYIAIVRDKVVAVGRSTVQAYKEAKKKYPKEEIGIYTCQLKRRLQRYEISLSAEAWKVSTDYSNKT